MLSFEQVTAVDNFEGFVLAQTLTSMGETNKKLHDEDRLTCKILVEFPTPSDSEVPGGINLNIDHIQEPLGDVGREGEVDTTSIAIHSYFKTVAPFHIVSFYVARTDIKPRDVRSPTPKKKPTKIQMAAKAAQERLARQQQEERDRQAAYDAEVQAQARRLASSGGFKPDTSGSMST